MLNFILEIVGMVHQYLGFVPLIPCLIFIQPLFESFGYIPGRSKIMPFADPIPYS